MHLRACVINCISSSFCCWQKRRVYCTMFDAPPKKSTLSSRKCWWAWELYWINISSCCARPRVQTSNLIEPCKYYQRWRMYAGKQKIIACCGFAPRKGEKKTYYSSKGHDTGLAWFLGRGRHLHWNSYNVCFTLYLNNSLTVFLCMMNLKIDAKRNMR